MSQSPARRARRRGVGEELVEDALDASRHALRGVQGVVPVRLVNVEQVQAVVAGVPGMHALITVELPDGGASWQFVLSPEDAGEAARRLGPIGDRAGSGLFVAGG